jgi:hypothetical protein
MYVGGKEPFSGTRADERASCRGNQSTIFGYAYPTAAVHNPYVLTRESYREAGIAGRE